MATTINADTVTGGAIVTSFNRYKLKDRENG